MAEILGSVRYLDSSPVANAQFFLLQNRTNFHYTEQSWNDLGLGLASLFAGTYYARRVAAPVNAPLLPIRVSDPGMPFIWKFVDLVGKMCCNPGIFRLFWCSQPMQRRYVGGAHE